MKESKAIDNFICPKTKIFKEEMLDNETKLPFPFLINENKETKRQQYDISNSNSSYDTEIENEENKAFLKKLRKNKISKRILIDNNQISISSIISEGSSKNTDDSFNRKITAFNIGIPVKNSNIKLKKEEKIEEINKITPPNIQPNLIEPILLIMNPSKCSKSVKHRSSNDQSKEIIQSPKNEISKKRINSISKEIKIDEKCSSDIINKIKLENNNILTNYLNYFCQSNSFVKDDSSFSIDNLQKACLPKDLLATSNLSLISALSNQEEKDNKKQCKFAIPKVINMIKEEINYDKQIEIQGPTQSKVSKGFEDTTRQLNSHNTYISNNTPISTSNYSNTFQPLNMSVINFYQNMNPNINSVSQNIIPVTSKTMRSNKNINSNIKIPIIPDNTASILFKEINIMSAIRDQQECRNLQNLLEKFPDTASSIMLPQLLNYFLLFCSDPFGNYLVQKILEKIQVNDFNLVALKIVESFSDLCIHNFGSRVIQKFIEVSTVEFLVLLEDVIAKNLYFLYNNPNGIHIISKYVARAKNVDFIFAFLENNIQVISKNKDGCCMIQKVFEGGLNENKIKLLNRISNFTLDFIVDKHANYIIQLAFNLAPYEVLLKIVNILFEDNRIFISLCKLKLSSNVIEKSFDTPNSKFQILIAESISKCEDEDIGELLIDIYGNYVIQKALSVAKGLNFFNMLNKISLNINKLNNVVFGPKLILKLINIYPELKNSVNINQKHINHNSVNFKLSNKTNSQHNKNLVLNNNYINTVPYQQNSMMYSNQYIPQNQYFPIQYPQQIWNNYPSPLQNYNSQFAQQYNGNTPSYSSQYVPNYYISNQFIKKKNE